MQHQNRHSKCYVTIMTIVIAEGNNSSNNLEMDVEIVISKMKNINWNVNIKEQKKSLEIERMQ